jgi:hypothetical protein
MRAHFAWSGVLALLSLVVPAAGCLLMLQNTGSLTGLVMILAGIPLAVAAWIALGTPVTRRHIQRAPNSH